MRAPCEKCGGEKAPGQGQRFCPDCKAAAQWVATRKREIRSIVLRRPCTICGGKKEPGHGRDYCAKCKAKRKPKRRCMSCPAEIDAPARKCERCRVLAAGTKRANERERHRRNRRLHPEWYAKPKAKAKPRKDNEGARMRHRLRAERAGRTVGPARVLPVGHGQRARHVPAAPLVPFLRQEVAADVSVDELGERAHMRPHELRKVIDGQTADLRDFQADRLCIALGLQFNLIYDLAQIA